LQQLPIRPVLLGNVYDPTLGDDNRNFWELRRDRSPNLQRMNTMIQEIAMGNSSISMLTSNGRSILVHSND